MKKVAERLSALGVLVFALGALTFLSASIASLTPAIAQQTTTNATSPEVAPEGGAATTEEHTDTSTVRDSVFALLADQTIPASGFIHLYDSTPYSITNGHVAAKIPCDDESAPLLNILVGVAPDLTPAPLELVPPLSTAGELCLYHVDLPPPAQANATAANATTTMITDIAIQNPGDEDVTLPSTSTVVIGVNEIMRGAHSHEGEEGGGEAQAGTP
jgi:hypothetical protein